MIETFNRMHQILAHLEASEKTLAEVTTIEGHPEVLDRVVGELSAMRGIVRKLLLTEEQLAITQSRLQTILDHAFSAIIGINEDGQVILWNTSAERLFGWTKEDALGKLLSDLIIPERYRARHIEGLKRMRGNGADRFFYRIIRAPALRLPAQGEAGNEFAVEMSIGLALAGGSVHYIAILRDPTEQQLTIDLEELLRGEAVAGAG